MAKRLLLILVFYNLVFLKSYSQGCSDAGFCTMGAMKPDQKFGKRANIHLRSIDLSHYVGYTKFDDVIQVVTLDAGIGITDKMSMQIKLPYSKTYGSLAEVGAISDISLCATRNLISKENYQFNLTAGTKIPTSNANLMKDGKPLPMYYQASLGTYDIIVGASWINKKWLFAAGYQQALNKNGNEFTWGKWGGDEDARRYPVSNRLQRGKDIMLRAERNFRLSRFNGYIGLLPIYRFTKDKITAPATGLRVDVEGSDGLALTALMGGGYRFSVRSGIKFLIGARIYERNKNPDGLSREFVNSIGYEFRF